MKMENSKCRCGRDCFLIPVDIVITDNHAILYCEMGKVKNILQQIKEADTDRVTLRL